MRVMADWYGSKLGPTARMLYCTGDGGGCGVEDGDIFDVVTHCWTGSLFADGLANYLAGV